MAYKIQFTNISMGHNGWICVMRPSWIELYGAKMDKQGIIYTNDVNGAFKIKQQLSDDKANYNYRYEVIEIE